MKGKAIFAICAAISLSGCGISAKIENIESAGKMGRLSIRRDISPELSAGTENLASTTDTMTVTGLNGERLHVMKRVTDSADVVHASENLSGVVVYATFKNIAERCGMVKFDFDVTVPKELQHPTWQTRFTPLLITPDDTLSLDKIIITGAEYRRWQLRGDELYSRYLSSIITDSTELRYNRLIEVFIERHLPELATLKTDTTAIPEDKIGHYTHLFQEVLSHYRKKIKIYRNDIRARKAPLAYERYVKDPIDTAGVKLDSIITECREIEYTYRGGIKAMAGVKKMEISLKGEIRKNGETIYEMGAGAPISLYISSLSSLAEVPDSIAEGGYSDGMEALLAKDYQKAIDLLAPYEDINSAIALASIGEYDDAEAILKQLPRSGRREYILAIIYAQKGDEKGALEAYLQSVEMEKKYRFRANLDPEISTLLNKYHITFNH